jgi:hypothetical protein
LNPKVKQFIRSYLEEVQNGTAVVRCGVCGSVTALFQLDDRERPICPRHGAGEPADKLLMEADAHLLLDYFFQPDMDNPQ